MEKKKVHLVLGSGGARGIAHIAVIEELEARGYEIVEVIGCSMGAVIGGIYAAGHLKEYKEWLFSLTRSDVFDLMDFTFTSRGFVKGEKIFSKLREMTGDLLIEKFGIPFTAVATDMKHKNEVHFRTGDLYKALRASVSIPGFFVPTIQEDNVLVDGGVLNPLPVNLVNKQPDALLVAVNLNARSLEKPVLDSHKEENNDKNDKEEQKWFEKIIPENVFDFSKKSESNEEEEEAMSLFGIMESTFSLTQDRLTELMLQLYTPDVLINIPRNTASTFEFFKAKQIFEVGRNSFKHDFKID